MKLTVTGDSVCGGLVAVVWVRATDSGGGIWWWVEDLRFWFLNVEFELQSTDDDDGRWRCSGFNTSARNWWANGGGMVADGEGETRDEIFWWSDLNLRLCFCIMADGFFFFSYKVKRHRFAERGKKTFNWPTCKTGRFYRFKISLINFAPIHSLNDSMVLSRPDLGSIPGLTSQTRQSDPILITMIRGVPTYK